MNIRRSQFHRAFSLIELTVVVTIIAILGAIAVPKWTRATQRYQIDLAAQRIASDISLAQQRANNSSTAVTISFNTTTNSYQIVGMPDRDRPAQTYTVNLAGSPYFAVLTSATFASSSNLSFDGFGTPLSGGTLVVTVADRQHTLTVDPNSGRVTIQ